MAAFDDDKRYWVKVTRVVRVLSRLHWRPGLPIQAEGHLIRQLMEKPENDGAIEVGAEVLQDEVF